MRLLVAAAFLLGCSSDITSAALSVYEASNCGYAREEVTVEAGDRYSIVSGDGWIANVANGCLADTGTLCIDGPAVAVVWMDGEIGSLHEPGLTCP
jgi:hypothetical protein